MDVASSLERTPPRSLCGLCPVSVSTSENKAVLRLRCGCESETGMILRDERFIFQCAVRVVKGASLATIPVGFYRVRGRTTHDGS